MSNSENEWTKLFGTIDVSMSDLRTAAAPVAPSPVSASSPPSASSLPAVSMPRVVIQPANGNTVAAAPRVVIQPVAKPVTNEPTTPPVPVAVPPAAKHRSVNPPAPAPQPVAPGVFQMATSFGTSMVKYVAGGLKTISPEKASQRLAVCKKCEYLNKTTCVACGCFVDLKVKMPHEHCPLNRWPQAE